VSVTAGPAPITGWTVRWTFANGQTVTQLWNGTLSVSGATVTVGSLDYNRSLNAGASTTFGFNGTWNGANDIPALTCSSP